MARVNCLDCREFIKERHLCRKRVLPGISASLLKSSGGYSPKDLSKTLRGLAGNHHLGYNVLNEADRMDRAMRQPRGFNQRIHRFILRRELESRFGLIDWREDK